MALEPRFVHFTGPLLLIYSILYTESTKEAVSPLLLGVHAHTHGHSIHASGMFALLKTLLVLHKREQPGTAVNYELARSTDFQAIRCSLPERSGPLPRLANENDEHIGCVHSFAANGHVAHIVLEGRKDWEGSGSANKEAADWRRSSSNVAASLARERVEEVKKESLKELMSNLRSATEMLPAEQSFRLKRLLKHVAKKEKKVSIKLPHVVNRFIPLLRKLNVLNSKLLLHVC